MEKIALSQKQKGHIIMFVAICIFGLNIPINKFIYAHHMLSPIGVTLLRMSFACLAFWIVSFFLPKEKVAKKDLLILLCGGVLGMAFNQGCFAYGLSQTTPVDASIITTSGPLFAMIIAAIILKEPITTQKVGGVFVGAIGAIILVYTSTHTITGNSSSWQGNVAVLCAQAFYATYLVITRPLSDRYSAVTMMKWMFLFAAILIFPFGIKDVIDAPLFQQHEKEPYMALSFVLLGGTFIAYMLIPMAQRRIRPTTISMYNNLQPLIASGVAISLGMDEFSITKVIAGIFIFGGVYLVTMSKSKADLEKEVLTTKE